MDWSKYAPYFSEAELRCKHTGQCHMQERFMDVLLAIRKEWGKPMKITSGYRHWSHPVEAAKGHKNGEHTKGLCVDVAITGGVEAAKLAMIAMKHGIVRIGVARTFLHLGMGDPSLPAPALWSY
jgi:uncharacterized protein YcbK (DUF882 family)